MYINLLNKPWFNQNSCSEEQYMLTIRGAQVVWDCKKVGTYCLELCFSPLSPARATFLTWPWQIHNSPADWARKLSKIILGFSKSSAWNRKKSFYFRFGVCWRDHHKWECFGFFLATFTWPWTPTHWAIILVQDFLGNGQNPHL